MNLKSEQFIVCDQDDVLEQYFKVSIYGQGYLIPHKKKNIKLINRKIFTDFN